MLFAYLELIVTYLHRIVEFILRVIPDHLKIGLDIQPLLTFEVLECASQ